MPLNPSIRTRSAAAAATLLLALLASAQAAAQGLPPLPGQQMAASDGRGQAQAQARYDFAYQSSDPRVLVFDDGRDTRIQLPAGVIMPTIVGIQTQGEVLVPPEVQSPYILARGVFQRVVLRWGNGQQIQVQYLGRTALAERNGPAGLRRDRAGRVLWRAAGAHAGLRGCALAGPGGAGGVHPVSAPALHPAVHHAHAGGLRWGLHCARARPRNRHLDSAPLTEP
jgi:hypothetical protein